MCQTRAESLQPIIAKPGSPPISAAGTSLVIREWTMSGPSWMHVHQSDDEAWHVLEGRLRFKLLDREVDATPGTTVFVPAGLAHTYQAIEPSRYLIILTPKIDRLITRLLDRSEADDLASTLGEFDTVLAEETASDEAAQQSGSLGMSSTFERAGQRHGVQSREAYLELASLTGHRRAGTPGDGPAIPSAKTSWLVKCRHVLSRTTIQSAATSFALSRLNREL